MKLDVTTEVAGGSADVHIAGDLDYVTAGGLVAAVARLLAEHTALRHVRLDCSGLAFCDSGGLSGLLLVHRYTSRAGAQLHLDHRPAHLDRILAITCLLDHLTAPCDDDAADIYPQRELAGESRTGGR
jgi:anti-anti-sigma factor